MMKRWLGWTFLALSVVLSACHPKPEGVSGRVVNEEGKPLAGAVVRIRATDHATVTDHEGNFNLIGLSRDDEAFITAWVSGYYINGVDNVTPGTQELEIVLNPLPVSDNPDYEWLQSGYHPGQGEDQGCGKCHSSQGRTDLGFSLPVDEWLQDAHSQSATNSRFLTMYNGTDMQGNQSPRTQFGYNRDYGSFPLRPDFSQPYYGPGYKLDFPATAGNCAACHTPAAAVNNPYGVDPTKVQGVAAEGIPCDFCHKIWAVILDPSSGLPPINKPGVLSYEFRRPPEGHQFFAGPLDDVAPGEDTYLPLQSESQICAPCHFGVFWDTTIYNSFGEWLDSPYSDPETGKTCQDCHMPPLGGNLFALPEEGGQARNPATIFSHRMPGASDEQLLQNAVTLTVDAHRKGENITVTVSILNDQTGHHVPTDSPLRQVLLLVKAQDSDGQALELIDGPVVPDWGGVGNPLEGYYAGVPGKGYAKILIEMWTEVSPTGAYWNPTRVLSDNRLVAFATDTSSYTFAAEPGEEAAITVSLLFRRAFIDLMDQKQWDVADIVMEEIVIHVP